MKKTKFILHLLLSSYLVAFQLIWIQSNFDNAKQANKKDSLQSGTEISASDSSQCQPYFLQTAKENYTTNDKSDCSKTLGFISDVFSLNNLTQLSIFYADNSSLNKNFFLFGVNPRSPPSFS